MNTEFIWQLVDGLMGIRLVFSVVFISGLVFYRQDILDLVLAYCDSIIFDPREYICSLYVGGKPWYGGDVGCGLYAMQLVDDWRAEGWDIGA